MSLPVVAETRLPCFALLAARLSSILQIINHSVLSADSLLVNCTLLRVAFRSSLLNDSIEVSRVLFLGICLDFHYFLGRVGFPKL